MDKSSESVLVNMKYKKRRYLSVGFHSYEETPSLPVRMKGSAQRPSHVRWRYTKHEVRVMFGHDMVTLVGFRGFATYPTQRNSTPSTNLLSGQRKFVPDLHATLVEMFGRNNGRAIPRGPSSSPSEEQSS